MKKKFNAISVSKRFGSILLVVASMLFCTACKDDENKNKKISNHFSVDGTEKAVKVAVLFFDQTPSESPVTGEDYYRHELVIYSDGFTFSEVNKRISGTGDVIDFMVTGASPNLDPGTYTFTANEEDPQPFEVWDSSVYVNYSTATQQGEIYVFKTGTLKVEKDGEIFTLNFEGTAYPPVTDGPWAPDVTKPSKSVKGYFKGTIAKYPD
jgi:hypothetical protein